MRYCQHSLLRYRAVHSPAWSRPKPFNPKFERTTHRVSLSQGGQRAMKLFGDAAARVKSQCSGYSNSDYYASTLSNGTPDFMIG